MPNEPDTIFDLLRLRRDEREDVLELERLLSCYQIATPDDKRIVWAVLNKYAPYILF